VFVLIKIVIKNIAIRTHSFAGFKNVTKGDSTAFCFVF